MEPRAEKPTQAMQQAQPAQHVRGALRVPDGVSVLMGSPNGARRSVGITVSKFNGEITTRLLDGALTALEQAGVERRAIDVMPVPGAFELPLAAMALAKTRRYACVIALGCVIRGETPHFEYISAEAASGLQLAALGRASPSPSACSPARRGSRPSPAPAGLGADKGADAARSALEMADVFARPASVSR